MSVLLGCGFDGTTHPPRLRSPLARGTIGTPRKAEASVPGGLAAKKRRHVDNPWQLPGEFVIASSGRIVHAHRYQYCEDFLLLGGYALDS
jgi:hypothetical protein